jgi:hypothetical protein
LFIDLIDLINLTEIDLKTSLDLRSNCVVRKFKRKFFKNSHSSQFVNKPTFAMETKTTFAQQLADKANAAADVKLNAFMDRLYVELEKAALDGVGSLNVNFTRTGHCSHWGLDIFTRSFPKLVKTLQERGLAVKLTKDYTDFPTKLTVTWIKDTVNENRYTCLVCRVERVSSMRVDSAVQLMTDIIHLMRRINAFASPRQARPLLRTDSLTVPVVRYQGEPRYEFEARNMVAFTDKLHAIWDQSVEKPKAPIIETSPATVETKAPVIETKSPTVETKKAPAVPVVWALNHATGKLAKLEDLYSKDMFAEFIKPPARSEKTSPVTDKPVKLVFGPKTEAEAANPSAKTESDSDDSETDLVVSNKLTDHSVPAPETDTHPTKKRSPKEDPNPTEA